VDTDFTDLAFNRIYDRTYRKTAAYLTARCGRLSEVEDLLQETYLAVYRVLSIKGVSFFENEEAYVLSVAKSKLTDWYRSAAARTVSLNDEDDAWLQSVPDSGPLPQETAEYRETSAAVQELVAGKSEALRQAFYLHCCFGVPFPEIARLQNRNESSVRCGVFRLTRELRGKLERSAR
jgi:RNA polymerase sigma factor (sigma-70 family)